MIKKIFLLAFLLIIGYLVSITLVAQTTPEPPDNYNEIDAGTEQNPYLISNLANLRWLSECPEDWWIDDDTQIHVQQTADIDATETSSWNNGTGFIPIGHPSGVSNYWEYFVGVYDGCGFIISNLYISATNEKNIGLFKYLKNSIILQVLLYNIEFSSSSGFNAGGISGYSIDSSISESKVSGSIYLTTIGNYSNAGGIVGTLLWSQITDSDTAVTIHSYATNSWSVGGGIAGENIYANITNCYAVGDVYVEINGIVGGISGNMSASTITNSWTSGIVSGGHDNGGILGEGYGVTIINCWSSADVIGNSLYSNSTGGIAGYTWSNSQISDCFFTGTTQNADHSGGIAGIMQGSIQNCFSTGNISGRLRAGGIAGGSNGIIINSYTIGEIIGIYPNGINCVGGIAGTFGGLIQDCYSAATVRGSNSSNTYSSYVGGITGWIGDASIIRTYFIGEVFSQNYLNPDLAYSGGLIGYISYQNANIQQSFLDGDASNTNLLVGHNSTPYNSIDNYVLTSESMNNIDTYIGNEWDINNTWVWDETINNQYPYLNGVECIYYNRPQNLQAEIFEGNVYLSWEAPIQGIYGNFLMYKVYKNDILIDQTTDLFFYDVEVELEELYRYKVKAVYTNPDIDSPPSNSTRILIRDLLPPENLISDVINNTVFLFWTSPTNNPLGFNIYKEDTLLAFQLISEEEFNQFIEYEVPNGEYTYRVNTVYEEGESPDTSIIVIVDYVSEIEADFITFETKLLNNYPNPFNPETVISYSLAVASILQIDIYNLKGQRVKTLINEYKPAGEYSVVWNGRDDNGQSVGSGIYFYKMETEDYSAVKRMVLMK